MLQLLFTVYVANVAQSWHSRSVDEGHLPSNCNGEGLCDLSVGAPAGVIDDSVGVVGVRAA